MDIWAVTLVMRCSYGWGGPDGRRHSLVGAVRAASTRARRKLAAETGRGGDEHALQRQHVVPVAQAQRGRVEHVADRALVAGRERGDHGAVDGQLDRVAGQEPGAGHRGGPAGAGREPDAALESAELVAGFISGRTGQLSSQVAVCGPALVLPHWALATARFCTTPQSPVAFSTGMPAAAAASGPGSLAWIWMTGSGRPYRTSLTWMNAATLRSFQPSITATVVPLPSMPLSQRLPML